MNLRALETLVRLLQVASFSKVAQQQNMTLSTLSMQMKTLEQALGAEIFDRVSRPPRLTPLGRRIAEQAKAVLHERDVLRALSDTEDPLIGTFRIGFLPSGSVRIMPGFLAIASGQAPGARFETVSGLSETLGEQVEAGLLDGAVITRVDAAQHGLVLQTIVTEDMGLAVPVGHGELDIPALCKTLPFLQFRPSTGIGRLIAMAVQALPEPPARTVILDGIEATVECVAKGLGFTVLPLPDLHRYGGGRVVVRPAGPVFPARDLVLATRPGPQAERWRARLLQLLVSATE